MADPAFDVAAIGEPLYEFNRRVDGGPWLAGYGGDTSNAAIAAARLGARVAYFTALGDDAFGRAFRDL
jgi:2-dehydro-3-deoxygluconokinase